MLATLPPYLNMPLLSAPQTFGTLRREGDLWVLEGDPQVVIMAKRVFPGSSGKGNGIAKFPANRRTFGDLVWFMQRWPLHVVDRELWDAEYAATCTYVRRRAEILAAPQCVTPPPLFTGTLRPFQQEGLAWMAANPRTLLADEMGLGKTPQALALMAALDQWPVLVVPPPHLVRHWEQKIGEFLASHEDNGLFGQRAGVRQMTLRGLKPFGLPDGPQIFICHYLLLRAWRRQLAARRFPVIVFDEIQELRHGGTEKYSAASHITDAAHHVVGLSGTPIYNRGGEIWHVMNILDYHCLGDWDSFTREWCEGYGTDTIKHPDALGAMLRRDGLILRRRKEDVLSDLPAKRRIVETVESKEGAAAELIKAARILAKQSGETADHLEKGRLGREAINSARQATGIRKAPAVGLFVRGLLEAEEPTLVFAYHHAVVDRLLWDLREFKPVCITGRETGQQKWESLEAFRTGKSNVIIISLRAATGLDGLQARARAVVFSELDWAPAVHTQAEDRAHRMGQHDSVLCYYLVSEDADSTDPDVLEALGLKAAQFIGIMGDTPETETDRQLAARDVSAHMARIVERLRKAA
jgi:SWI/SNF-related matrix-associated actin-dependent regulator of chromatin subfamily A-like protein 1